MGQPKKKPASRVIAASGGVAMPFIKLGRVFSVQECREITKIGLGGELTPGKVWDAGKKAYVLNEESRRVLTSYHPKTKRTSWVYERLDSVFAAAATMFGFDIDETKEELKFLSYRAGDHFGTWHMDTGRDYAQFRKISVTIELSDSDSYTGGSLEIFPDALGSTLRVPQGGGVAFPSFRFHRVTPVTAGIRYSLVNWVSGPAFR